MGFACHYGVSRAIMAYITNQGTQSRSLICYNELFLYLYLFVGILCGEIIFSGRNSSSSSSFESKPSSSTRS